MVAYVHTCYVLNEIFNKIFPQENIGVWGAHPVNCEWLACLGVYWEFVIFTIPISPNGTTLAMFTRINVTILKTRGLLISEKIFPAQHFLPVLQEKNLYIIRF